MYTLIYPAVLGSLIVSLFSSNVIVAGNDFYFLFALFIAIYFGSQHVQNTVDLAAYSWPSFWMDCIEIVFVYCFYLQLGLLDNRFQSSEVIQLSTWVYLLFALGFLLPIFARFLVHGRLFQKVADKPDSYRENWMTSLSLGAFILAICIVAINWFEWQIDQRLFLYGLYGILTFYVVVVVFERSKCFESDSVKTPPCSGGT
ncbi:MAG: hypothetical protein AAGI44_13685 [Pseudomonadota bacterium]